MKTNFAVMVVKVVVKILISASECCGDWSITLKVVNFSTVLTFIGKLTKIKNETIVYLLCIDYIPTIVLVTGGHIVSIAYPNFFRPGHYTVSNGFFDDHQHLITNHNQSFMPNALLRVLSTTILLWLHTKDQFYFCHDGHTSGKKQALM